ncbi:MAG: anhydro-N-acetylmuramic acid kinase [marine benthic group bacterium]|nr:anhydro-N-acetylmuramic acid kinase [Gemmatimonadota bacterium]
MSDLYVGLMSGTSLDGIDAALIELRGSAERPDEANLVAFRTDPYESEMESRLSAAVSGRAGSAELCDLGFDLGERFAAASLALLGDAGIDPGSVIAIGSHGQTVWHRPPSGHDGGATLQLGESAVIAERTGIDVIHDFRVRDVAAGGHGAPLTPLFDLLVLSDPDRGRAIQNIGGMANVTGLPAEASGAAPTAFDTGPGVALIDEATRLLTSGAQRFDLDGSLAASGEVVPAALDAWLTDPFFAKRPPRSTGRERFGSAALTPWLDRFSGERTEDLLATLTELTARTISDAHGFLGFEPDEVLLCGGGARNPELVRRIRTRLDCPVHPLEFAGWDGDAREAAAFALLARQHRLGFPSDLGWATGARGSRLLGKMTPA